MTSAEKTTKDLRFELFIFGLAEEQLDAIVVVQRLVGDATKSANWANRIKILLGELHVKTSLVLNKKVAKAFRSTEQNRSGDAEYWNDSQLTWDSSMAQDYQIKKHGFIRFQILKMIRVRSKQLPILTNTHLDPKWFGWITILVLSIPHSYSYINS